MSVDFFLRKTFHVYVTERNDILYSYETSLSINGPNNCKKNEVLAHTEVNK